MKSILLAIITVFLCINCYAQEKTDTIGEFADIDHLIPAQTDHRFRGKLTT